MTAYFVSRPRTIADLRRPHLLSTEREYEITKTIRLSKTDYENFSLDLLADRAFIEENQELCREEPVYRCLLVKAISSKEGILVLPGNKCFVKYAAFYSEEAP